MKINKSEGKNKCVSVWLDLFFPYFIRSYIFVSYFIDNVQSFTEFCHHSYLLLRNRIERSFWCCILWLNPLRASQGVCFFPGCSMVFSLNQVQVLDSFLSPNPLYICIFLQNKVIAWVLLIYLYSLVCVIRFLPTGVHQTTL